jgi:hypothetical protein
MATYRLTPSEYLEHLEGHEDPEPNATRRKVWLANGTWTDDGTGTAAWDHTGFYWVRTDDLRVPNWNGVEQCTPSDSLPR